MKDIFIDTNIAKNFTNPMDPEYKKLVAWLLKYNPTTLETNAILVTSNKLIHEYYSSAQNAHTDTSIPVIIDILIRQGRRILITNQQIKDFQGEYFKKKVVKKLRCNDKDHDHIPLVLLSTRKYALSIDDNFVYDINNFPGFNARAEKRPEHLPYEL